MSLTNYSELKTEIASWLNRTTLTDDQLSTFIALAEDDIRNDLWCRDSDQRTTGTLTADGFDAPAGYLSTRLLVVDGKPVKYLAPEAYAAKVQGNDTTTKFYTVNGDEFSVLGGTGTDIELLYRATIVSLSDTNTSNWVLVNASNIYLFGGCKYGSIFLRDAAAAGGYKGLYDEAMAKLNKLERESRWSGPLVVRAA